MGYCYQIRAIKTLLPFGGSNVITFWSQDTENAYVAMGFLFQIFCDEKIQQILQETNALKVAELLADFLYLYKKQTN